MQGKNSYRIGPGAASLLLIVLVLCLTVLGILALSSARSDYRLAQRNESMIQGYYKADAQTQRALADLDAVIVEARALATDSQAYMQAIDDNLPAGFELEDDKVVYRADAGADRSLEMSVHIGDLDEQQRYNVLSVNLTDVSSWEELTIEGLM